MRIDGWKIGAFGPISNWSVSGLAGRDLVVILGPNESGKSALFEFFSSGLFGFSPARAARHHYRPWGGQSLEGRLDVVLQDGRPARLARRLTSRPEGQVTISGDVQGLANHPAPWVGAIDRSVFKNVYALTQEEALELGEQGWQVVQDLLGGSSFDILQPSRKVVEALDAECRRLWRSGRYTQPKAYRIRSQIRELRANVPDARERRTHIERINSRLQEIRTELDANTRELQRIELDLERDATLAPLMRRVERMEQMNGQADELVPESALPEETPEQRSALVEGLKKLAQSQTAGQREIERLEQALQIDDSTRRLLDARGDIERNDRELALAQSDRDRIERMNADLQLRAGALREVASRALASEVVDEAAHDAILSLSVAELRGRLRVAIEARRKLEAAAEVLRTAESNRARLEQALDATGSMPSRVELDKRLREWREIEAARRLAAEQPPTRVPLPTPLLAAIGLAGAVTLAIGLGVGGQAGTLLVLLGAGTLAAVASAFATRRRSGALPASDWDSRLRRLDLDPDADVAAEIARAQAMRDAALRREVDIDLLVRASEAEAAAREMALTAEAAVEVAQAELLAVIAEVPLAPIHRESPDEGLVRDLEELRQSIRDTRRLQRNRDEVAKQFASWISEVERMSQTLGIELPSEPFESAPAARRALRDALEVERAAADAAAKLPELRDLLKTCGQERQAAVLEVEFIDTLLTALDPHGSDPLAGLDRFQKALDLRAEARRILADLDRDTPDWRDRVYEAAEIVAAGESVGLSDAERVVRRLRAEKLRADSQNLADERGRLDTKLDQLDSEPGPAHIQGAIDAADEQLTLVRLSHDRLALLRQVIREAERSYRDQYQSPLLAAAGTYLRGFTGDRYDLLTVDDASSGDGGLRVRRVGADFPEEVKTPLSRGTIQQIYFALRLAMVDLVEGDEPLPLFLDEMFVNWDPGRTTSGLAALANMPGDRQVFLFTADPFWAERAVQDVPAHIVRTPAA